MTVFLAAGIAVDVVRFEAKRARLQNTLDRAILAAADMSQSMSSEEVVEAYFDKAGLSEYLASVHETNGFNSKIVSATGYGTMDTYFMKLMGINELIPAAAGTAEESISDIEISLVLDVSGSMNEYIYATTTYDTRYGSRTYRYNTGEKKIEALINAAKEFVDTIFNETVESRTSMSIIPYNMQVNAGPDLFGVMAATTPNTVNTCAIFSVAQFGSSAMPSTLTRSDFFDMDNNTTSPSESECNSNSYSRIKPLGGTASTLKTMIGNLVAGGNTSIELGMKWGVGLLDPSMRPAVTSLIGLGKVPAEFIGRPFDYTNIDTMKVIVVMTDGINTSQYVLNDSYKDQMSGVYRYWYNNQWNYSVNYPEGNNTSRDGDSTKNETYWHKSRSGTDKWSNNAGYSTAVATQLTYRQLWQSVSIKYHQQSLREDIRTDDGSYGSAWSVSNVTSTVDNSMKDSRLDSICTAAKNQGIIVFSIGFEVTDASANVLQKCASSASHFYRVNGLEITTAFQSIANAIGKLRLTQ